MKTTKTKSTTATKRQHTPTGRSSTGQFASFTDAPVTRTKPARFINDAGLSPLQTAEYDELYKKMECVEELNLALIEASQAVDERRAELLEAEAALKMDEDALRSVRDAHQTALREVAPLLKRLPTV